MRKATSRQTAILPLGMKNRLHTELPALVALTAIGEPWFSTGHRSDLLAVALVVGEMAPEDSLQAQCAEELKRLCENEVTMDRKVDIALNLAECLPWLQVQSNTRVQRALHAVASRHCPMAA
jgi:hypothetical protein